MDQKQLLKVDISFFKGYEPQPILTVSTWADAHRILSQKASAEPGKWQTSRTPYLKEIMDCLSATSLIQEVVFMKGAQIGGTECGNNWIGYVIDYAPGPMLAVSPTVEMAKRNSKQRIDPLIEECPSLKTKVGDKRSKDASNTVLAKEFPGGVLVLTGANSAVGLRSLPARYLFLDEVDGYPGDIDGEGDPVALAKARARTFSRKKIFEVSTPTLEKSSRINTAFEKSDRRYYHLPCPFCGEFQKLKWKNIRWDNNDASTARYVCEFCEKDIDESHKGRMLKKGKWVAENPESKIAGFHLNSLYSPLGWFSWEEAVEQWFDAKKNQEKLKYFVNTVLGEVWRERGDVPNWENLYNKRENYERCIVNNQVMFLTCAADVQKNRIEAEVKGWNRNKESWAIEYYVFPGDTSTDAPWIQLEELLNTVFKTEAGGQMPILKMGVDSGYNTSYVYNWVRKFPINRVYAFKGMDGLNAHVGIPKLMDINFQGKKIKRGVTVWPVGSSFIKQELYGWLNLSKHIDSGLYPQGYCHFPEYEQEYFKQLTAEQLVAKMNSKGYKTYQFEKTRERNESLDISVYNRALANIVGMDRFNDKQWDDLSKNIGVQGQTQNKPAQKRRIREKSIW